MQSMLSCQYWRVACLMIGLLLPCNKLVWSKLIDNHQALSPANKGILKSFEREKGAGREVVKIPDSSLFILKIHKWIMAITWGRVYAFILSMFNP